MRRGISLLITLSVITAMLSLVGIMFSYIEVAHKKAEFKSSLIETNILLSDVKGVLDKILGRKPSKDTLKMLYSTPLVIQESKNNFMIAANCKPLLDRIRISWLGYRDDRKHIREFNLAKGLFDQITEQAGVADADVLFEMISEYLNGYGGYFNVPSRLKRKKFTIGIEDFRKILDRYRYELDDVSVYKVNWLKYYTFISPDMGPKGMDASFISAELIPFLFDVDLDYVKENYTAGDIDELLESIGEDRDRYRWLFSKSSSVAIECVANYSYRNMNYTFSFDYIDKRILNFDIQSI